MSISITTDVFCDICGSWTFGAVGSKSSPQAARCNARRQGWLRCRSPISNKMSDICDVCAKEYGLIKGKKNNENSSS